VKHYPWSILSIEPTREKQEIKKAYARLLKTIDQKQDPKAFQTLREAYDQALRYSEYINQTAADVNTEKFADKRADSHVPDIADTETPDSEDVGEENHKGKNIPESPQSNTEQYLFCLHKTLTEGDEQAAILELQSFISGDHLESLDVRYDFEGALLLIVNSLDSMPIEFARYLIKAFAWQPHDNPFRYDRRFNYAYSYFMSSVQRYEAREHIKNNYANSSLEGIDTVGEIIFSPFDEKALNRMAESPPLRQTAHRLLKYTLFQRYPDDVNPVDYRTFAWWDKNVEELYEPPAKPQPNQSTRSHPPFFLYIFLVVIMLQGVRTCSVGKDSFHTNPSADRDYYETFFRSLETNPRIDPRLQKIYPGSYTETLPVDSLGYKMEITPNIKQNQAAQPGTKTAAAAQPESVKKPVNSSTNHKVQPKIVKDSRNDAKIVKPGQVSTQAENTENKSTHAPMRKLNDRDNSTSLNYRPRFKNQDEDERSEPVDYMKPSSDWLKLK